MHPVQILETASGDAHALLQEHHGLRCHGAAPAAANKYMMSELPLQLG